MKKLELRTVGAAGIALLALGLSAGAVKAQDGPLETLVPGVLTCATDGAYAPLAYTTPSGKLEGVAVRVVEEVVRRTGLKYNPIVTGFAGALPGLLADKWDMVCVTLDITAERQKSVLFADAWLESGGILVVHKDSNINEVKDVQGKVMGVLTGSSWVKLVEPLGAKEVKYFQSDIEAMHAVANGRVDGMVTEALVAAHAIGVTKLPLKTMKERLSTTQKGWATRTHRVNLVKAINKALASMVEDGTYEKLTTELIGYNPYPKNPIRSIIP